MGTSRIEERNVMFGPAQSIHIEPRVKMTVEWRIRMHGKESYCDQMGGEYKPTNLTCHFSGLRTTTEKFSQNRR